ncbi:MULTISPECIES: hypothetical protein [unclassified Methylophaga]|jgi:hypothetical protein|uniref:hypothetical protein n=2 Tax=Methylophaga TaxID=40222 RepID=UPI000C971475|nr:MULTISPECIES: hypothetical protein [unclassified Methylophaga]MAK67529.1 hypothetical protein [Methylophaga sp.]MAY18762.1 hypothetical protein [Methylophaga sp.]HAO25748.1 hypothetical protein [Methylophaga sp.]|tara:strand:+ start:38524 stop:38742 length:219 start_codon:yes stop_codon:yes gene_type:complete
MRKLEQLKEQALQLLKEEGALHTHQLASMCTTVVSITEMNEALIELNNEELVDFKVRVGWYLQKDNDDADNA